MSKQPYQPVENAFRDGKIEEQNNESLSSFLIALSNEVVPNENVRHRDIIRGLTINHILLQRHIERLNKQNSKIQKLVIVLTVAAVIIGIPQLWFAYKADKRAETEQTTKAISQALPEKQSETPSLVLPPSSGQATKKAP